MLKALAEKLQSVNDKNRKLEEDLRLEESCQTRRLKQSGWNLFKWGEIWLCVSTHWFQSAERLASNLGPGRENSREDIIARRRGPLEVEYIRTSSTMINSDRKLFWPAPINNGVQESPVPVQDIPRHFNCIWEHSDYSPQRPYNHHSHLTARSRVYVAACGGSQLRQRRQLRQSCGAAHRVFRATGRRRHRRHRPGPRARPTCPERRPRRVPNAKVSTASAARAPKIPSREHGDAPRAAPCRNSDFEWFLSGSFILKHLKTCWNILKHFTCISPPARWGLLDFKIALRAFSSSSSSPPRLLASSWSQWALLDLNCQLPIPVSAAGPQQPSPDISGHCWTSTRDLSSPEGTAGPQPGTSRAQWAPLDLNHQTSRAQWAPLDLNRGPPEPSGHRWTSTAR